MSSSLSLFSLTYYCTIHRLPTHDSLPIVSTKNVGIPLDECVERRVPLTKGNKCQIYRSEVYLLSNNITAPTYESRIILVHSTNNE